MRKKLLSIIVLLSLTVTSAWADAYTDAAKANLQKVVAMAELFGLDTSNAKALIAKEDATLTELSGELSSLGTATKNKANEAIDLAEKFFKKFDATAAAVLADDFSAAKTALEGNNFDAISGALQQLAADALVAGQSAMTKVDEYLRKMEDETLNADLDVIKSLLLSSSDINSTLKSLIAAVKNMKEDLPDAAQAYLNTVNALIAAGDEDAVSDMKDARDAAILIAGYYTLEIGDVTVVDLGDALYKLISAVEEYKEKQAEVPTGINGITAEKLNNVYNLNGQRVEKAQKGLYIINGKKVMVK